MTIQEKTYYETIIKLLREIREELKKSNDAYSK